MGTLDTMPLREEGDLLFGPGALDMKAGVVVGLEAIRGLRDRGELPDRPIWLFLNTDEEIGSINTRALIEESLPGWAGAGAGASRGSRGAQGMAQGIARYVVRTVGRAAHSGNAPKPGSTP